MGPALQVRVTRRAGAGAEGGAVQAALEGGHSHIVRAGKGELNGSRAGLAPVVDGLISAVHGRGDGGVWWRSIRSGPGREDRNAL